jgi:hypothetical protein
LSKDAKITAIIVSILWAGWSGMWTWAWIYAGSPTMAIVSAVLLVLGVGIAFGQAIEQDEKSRARKAMIAMAERHEAQPQPAPPAPQPTAPAPKARTTKGARPGTFRYEWQRGPRWAKTVLGIGVVLAILAIIGDAMDSSTTPKEPHAKHHHRLTAHKRYVRRICGLRHVYVPAIANLLARDLRNPVYVDNEGRRHTRRPRADARAANQLADAYDEVYRAADRLTNTSDVAPPADGYLAPSAEAAQQAQERDQQRYDQSLQEFDDAYAAAIAADHYADQLARQFGLGCIRMTPPDE